MDHQQIVLSYLSLHALALHLAVKNITSNLLVWRFEHVGLYIRRLYFPPECQQGPQFLLRNQYYYENIPNIWHKSSTKHKEVRPDWNDKNDNANHAPLVSKEGFTNGGSWPFFKEIFDQVCEKIYIQEIALFWTKRHNVSHYIYYLATDNIHIVLENEHTVLIKGLQKVV